MVGVHAGFHDAAAVLFDDYRLVAAVQLERLTRRKGDGDGIPWACIDEVLTIAGATRRDVDVVACTRNLFPRNYLRSMGALRERFWPLERRFRRGRTHKYLYLAMHKAGTLDAHAVFDEDRFRRDGGFRADTRIHFTDHHRAHALPSLFFTPWEEALLYTHDGGGDLIAQSARVYRDGDLEVVLGGEASLLNPPVGEGSLGQFYGRTTAALGYRMNRHEGKLTGLAAVGSPVLYETLRSRFTVTETGAIHSHWPSLEAMIQELEALAATVSAADMAATVQAVTEDVAVAAVETLIRRHPVRHLGLAGGLFANVRLNRRLVEDLGLAEVFVVPAMGDEGLPLGAVLDFLLQRDGLAAWSQARHRLPHVSLGRDYDQAASRLFAASPDVRRCDGDPAAEAAQRLADGQIGALYAGRMEYGPRALGARSILANPARKETHDVLNDRLSRSEFMPFAPVVLEEDAADVFAINRANHYATRFMTITTLVQPAWRTRIPAVVHVDQTARPQVIDAQTHPLYAAVLTEFKKRTGLPCLVNTSFNVHEEPIVNRPDECLAALRQQRVDFVITPEAVWALRQDGS